jgi:hypothetical protein
VKEEGCRVETLQVTLGQALLALMALMVALFAIIVILAEANLILRLGGKLLRRWKSAGLDTKSTRQAAEDVPEIEHPRDGRTVP